MKRKIVATGAGHTLLREPQSDQLDLRMQNESLRLANAALEESRQHYLDLYNFSPVACLTLTDQGSVSEINLTGSTLLGIPREGLIGRSFAELFITAEYRRWEEFFLRLMRSGGAENAEFTLAKGAHGAEVGPCVRVDCLRLLRADAPLMVHVALTDISRMKRVEATLQESEARYHAIFNSASNGLVLADVSTRRIVGANPAFRSMIGCEPDGFVDRTVDDIFPAHETARALEAFVQAAAGKITFLENIELQRCDGSLLHVDINSSPVVLAGERLVLGEFHDISWRTSAEIAVRDREAFFRLVAENIDGYIAVLDTDGRRVYNSPSYVRLLGDRPVVGTDSFASVHPDDCVRVREAFFETVASGVGQHLEYRFVMPDGGIRLMESRGGVIRDRQGRSRQVVIVANDVTERYEADQKIHHLAFYDPLTQLANRLTLNDRLLYAMAASKRSGRYGALMFVDLDYFKAVNDTYGHGAGDQLLVQAANRLTGCVREMDTVARFGGDEFIVLLGELDADFGLSFRQAHRIAEKIQEAVSQNYVLETRTDEGLPTRFEHRCTASIGIALFRDHEHGEEEILKLADRAMYRAKEEGRNAIHFYRGFSLTA